MDVSKRLVKADEEYSSLPALCTSMAITEVEQSIGAAMIDPACFRSSENPCVMRPLTERFAGRMPSEQPLPAELRGAVMALGNFDGFHLGHQKVALRAVELARSRGVAAILGTFDPHPAAFFKRNAKPSRLTTLAQRQRLAAAIGIDAVLVFGFNAALSAVSPEDFVRCWLAGLGGVVTGEDFRFGLGRVGNVELLQELGERNGLVCATVAPVLVGDDTASSTRIREALEAGDCGAAARILTRPYTIEGVVSPSRRINPALPVLAVSIRLAEYLRPRCGMYAVRATLSSGRVCCGSAYLAHAPGTPQQELDLFLPSLGEIDFGSQIEVELIAHLHDAVQSIELPYVGNSTVSFIGRGI